MKEKRLHPRVTMQAAVQYEAADGVAGSGTALDMSIGGMFIESADPPAIGTDVTIVLSIPGSAAALRLPAIARWKKPGGFGVQFGLLGARETHAVAEYIRKHR